MPALVSPLADLKVRTTNEVLADLKVRTTRVHQPTRVFSALLMRVYSS
jgi:hypothetical protein